MIRKLRFKFILLSMAAVFLVLSLIIAGINVVNYRGVIREADALLDILSENRGSFPRGPGDGKGGRLPPNMSQEVPYETRYFSVLLSRTGELIQTDTSRIVTVEQSAAEALARSVLQEGQSRGFSGNFRYAVSTEGETTRILFLDCGRKLDAFRSFLFASIAISLLGYVVVLLLIAFFSNRIVRPMAESYEKQKRFITDAGHELKTPLTIISADVDVLAMDLGENEWLEDIQKQTRRLTALTEDLVYLSRMEEAEVFLTMIDFPFSEAVSEAASSFQALAQTQNKVFLCDIQPMLSLKGDERAIQQLVSILLDNALKYSPQGGSVRLTAEKQNRTLLLSVGNTTENQVSKEQLNLLFERFYRTDLSRSARTGGYGIGLSVAKAIAEAHNGKIQARTEDGHSLLVTVSFPI